MSKRNNLGTFIITDAKVIIKKQDGIKRIALKLISGAATFSGTDNVEILGGNSQPIPLVIGEAVSLSNKESIDRLIIDASTGTGNVVHIITNTTLN